MLHFWYAALREDLGVRILSSQPDTTLQALYQARKKALDPDLEALTILRTNSGELWITRKSKVEEIREALKQAHSPS